MWVFVQQLLFESPYALVAVLLACAAIGTIAALCSRGRRRRGWGGVAGLFVVMAMAPLILAPLVVTPRERILARMHALLDHTVPFNRTAIRRMMDFDASFVDRNDHTCFDAVRTIAMLESLTKRLPIARHEIVEEAATLLEAETAESSLKLWTYLANEKKSREAGLASSRVTSAWRIRWRYDEGDAKWRMTQIQCTRFLQTIYPSCGLW